MLNNLPSATDEHDINTNMLAISYGKKNLAGVTNTFMYKMAASMYNRGFSPTPHIEHGVAAPPCWRHSVKQQY